MNDQLQIDELKTEALELAQRYELSKSDASKLAWLVRRILGNEPAHECGCGCDD